MKIKRFYLFIVIFDLLFLYFTALYWNSMMSESVYRSFGLKYTIIFLISGACSFALPAFCAANLLEELWCKIFKTKNYYD